MSNTTPSDTQKHLRWTIVNQQGEVENSEDGSDVTSVSSNNVPHDDSGSSSIHQAAVCEISSSNEELVTSNGNEEEHEMQELPGNQEHLEETSSGASFEILSMPDENGGSCKDDSGSEKVSEELTDEPAAVSTEAHTSAVEAGNNELFEVSSTSGFELLQDGHDSPSVSEIALHLPHEAENYEDATSQQCYKREWTTKYIMDMNFQMANKLDSQCDSAEVDSSTGNDAEKIASEPGDKKPSELEHSQLPLNGEVDQNPSIFNFESMVFWSFILIAGIALVVCGMLISVSRNDYELEILRNKYAACLHEKDVLQNMYNVRHSGYAKDDYNSPEKLESAYRVSEDELSQQIVEDLSCKPPVKDKNKQYKTNAEHETDLTTIQNSEIVEDMQHQQQPFDSHFQNGDTQYVSSAESVAQEESSAEITISNEPSSWNEEAPSRTPLDEPSSWNEETPSSIHLDEPSSWNEETPSSIRLDEPSSWNEETPSSIRLDEPSSWNEETPSSIRLDEPSSWNDEDPSQTPLDESSFQNESVPPKIPSAFDSLFDVMKELYKNITIKPNSTDNRRNADELKQHPILVTFLQSLLEADANATDLDSESQRDVLVTVSHKIGQCLTMLHNLTSQSLFDLLSLNWQQVHEMISSEAFAGEETKTMNDVALEPCHSFTKFLLVNSSDNSEMKGGKRLHAFLNKTVETIGQTVRSALETIKTLPDKILGERKSKSSNTFGQRFKDTLKSMNGRFSRGYEKLKEKFNKKFRSSFGKFSESLKSSWKKLNKQVSNSRALFDKYQDKNLKNEENGEMKDEEINDIKANENTKLKNEEHENLKVEEASNMTESTDMKDESNRNTEENKNVKDDENKNVKDRKNKKMKDKDNKNIKVKEQRKTKDEENRNLKDEENRDMQDEENKTRKLKRHNNLKDEENRNLKIKTKKHLKRKKTSSETKEKQKYLQNKRAEVISDSKSEDELYQRVSEKQHSAQSVDTSEKRGETASEMKENTEDRSPWITDLHSDDERHCLNERLSAKAEKSYVSSSAEMQCDKEQAFAKDKEANDDSKVKSEPSNEKTSNWYFKRVPDRECLLTDPSWYFSMMEDRESSRHDPNWYFK